MTAPAKEVAHFFAGDDVPAWLIDRDPHSPSAVNGSLKFMSEVKIIEAFDAYYVLPAEPHRRYFIEILDAKDCTFFAPAKKFVLPTAFMTMTPEKLTAAAKFRRLWRRFVSGC